MILPFFSAGISKNQQWRIVLYSYIHNGGSRGDCNFLREGSPNGISSPLV